MKRVLLFLSIVAGTAGASSAQNVSLTVTGIKSAKGALMVSVFKDEAAFRDNKPATKLRVPKTGLAGGTMKLSLNLAPGTWGIAMLDDENGNGKMDNNMIGMPKEGFGFSNFYLSGMSHPSFNDFRFEVKSAPLNLSSKLRYL